MDFKARAKTFSDSEDMASAYLAEIYGNGPISFPINPFELLRKEGILFTLSDFKTLEGVYIPANNENDIPVVAINANRPITRQRFSAAHELCHHFRDVGKQVCHIGNKNRIEKFAEGFAAAVLMPYNALLEEVNNRRGADGNVSFDEVLAISHYFGVSFEACVFRIAYRIHAIEGNTEACELRKRIQKYKPEKVRQERRLTYASLYAGLLDNYREQLTFEPNDYARFCFQNDYIYNDSRMEGLDITIVAAAEIVTDLRLNTQHSEFCKEENEAFMSIAGHYAMYEEIFSIPVKEEISVFEASHLHAKLFSCYQDPEFGGATRTQNTLVLGAKFETVDHTSIFPELLKLESEVKATYEKRDSVSVSEYIKHVARIHHRFTVIHPFPEGNGRTSRAFMNVQLVRAKIPPIYIKVENKNAYIDALSIADRTGNYDLLYEILFKEVLRSSVALKSFGMK